jgi:hypothetical protein
MDPDNVDELRQRLRSLGYLDAGVDRFVLGPAHQRRGPAVLAARLALRVGLLGGVLLGPAAAIGVGARLPGLVNGVRDAAVIGLYLAVVFLLAVSVLSWLVSLTALAIRRPSLSRVAGWIIAATTLLYLTFWWRNANAGFGWSAPVWTSFALLIAVAISLLLGHAQRIATIAVLAAAAGPDAPLPRFALRSWRIILGAGAVAFAGAAALLFITASSEAQAMPEPPPLTVVSRGQRVRLIAIDGFDRNTYVQLRSTLPRLSHTLGWRSALLAQQDTSDPARAWTTIATGVTPEAHGVHAIETRRVAGLAGTFGSGGDLARLIGGVTDAVRLTRPAVASRDDRRAKTMWEVAEQAGLKTSVINWWATWPAPPHGGTIVTDRALLRLEVGGTLDAEIAPADIYDRLRAQWPAIRQEAKLDAQRAFPNATDPRIADILRRSAELDGSIAAIARWLPAADVDLLVVYLPGLDIAQNALLGTAAGALTPSDAAARVEALRSYYPFLDRIAGPLLEPAEQQIVMLVTQPGRVQSGAGLFAVGPDYATSRMSAQVAFPGDVLGTRRAEPLDVAPTIWRALGIPLSRELAGKPIGALLGDAFDVTDRVVETYGRPSVTSLPRGGKPLDQEMIDRLRSLGYVR